MKTKESDISEIDLNNLDEEWRLQDERYQEAARKLADAKEKLRRAELDQELAEAEIKLDIRRFPDKYSLGKNTEDAIKSAMILQKEYREAVNDVIDAKHEVDLYGVEVERLQQRKYALQDLTSLYICGYWAKPRVSGEAGDEMKRRERAGDLRRRKE